jgi:hypothetical protein
VAPLAAKLRAADSLNAVLERRRNALASDLVLLAGVVSIDTTPAQDTLARRRGGEHAPRWVAMRAQVRRVFRGPAALSGEELRVLFPGSRDILYAASPRPVAAGEYLLMIRRIGRLPARFRVGLDSATTWVIYEPLDLLPPGDSSTVVLPPSGRP